MYELFLCDYKRKPKLVEQVSGKMEEECKKKANAFFKTEDGRRLCRGYRDIQFTDDRSCENNLRTGAFKNSKKMPAWFEIRKQI